MKRVIYTALFTDDLDYLYGDVIHYKHDKGDIDYVCYTNSPHLKSDFWDVRHMDLIEGGGRWTARYCKTSPQVLLPEYDEWLWMDNEIYFNYDPDDLFNTHLAKNDLAVHQHCDRICIYDEAVAANGRMPRRDPAHMLMDQVATYRDEGYPTGIGLYENGILYRKNNEAVRTFNKLWWKETRRWNTEDQISMMYALYNTEPKLMVNPLKQTFVSHQYTNSYLPLTDQFACLPRSNRKVG